VRGDVQPPRRELEALDPGKDPIARLKLALRRYVGILETLIELEDGRDLPIGLRVRAFIGG
jgi:hypothetical protein